MNQWQGPSGGTRGRDFPRNTEPIAKNQGQPAMRALNKDDPVYNLLSAMKVTYL